MRNIWTMFKKEVYRVLSDARLVVMVFIVPGLSIFVMYSLMGNIMQGQADAVEEHEIVMIAENLPQDLKTMLEARDLEGNQSRLNITIDDREAMDDDTLEQKILDGDIDIALLFDEDFTEKIANPDLHAPPSLHILYNHGRQPSSFAYNRVNMVLMEYRERALIERLEDPNHYIVFDHLPVQIADERVVSGQAMAMLMPMLVIIFLFAGAMSIGPDAIAGEKERNTIATLLITPTKRSEIAIGKVASLAVLSLASALSSFIGILAGLQNLMGEDASAGLSIYGLSEYVLILMLLMSTVLFIVGLIAVVSAFAKTIKEASMLIMPFYFVTIIVGVASSFGAEPATAWFVHLIPLYGATNALSAVFTFNVSLLNIGIVCAASVVYTIVLVFILNRMFQSERIMFQK